MTEELRKEATTTVQWECTPMIDRPTFINGYITGAEPREKRIEDLEAQIEIMKTRIKEIIFSNDFVNNSPYQNLEKKVRALCDFYNEIK